MKVRITMSEKNEFDWDYTEAETNERLIALVTTMDTLRGDYTKSEESHEYSSEIFNSNFVLTRMLVGLLSYADNNNYDLGHFNDVKSVQGKWRSEREGLISFGSKREGLISKLDDFEIDESQFEVPDQNQRTL